MISIRKLRCAAALAAGLWLAAGAAAADTVTEGRVPLPEVNITKPGQCVEPTDVMRRRHMEFILHQRDETMHLGIRTKRYSLKNCVNCHADPVTNSVLGENGFCQECHSYAAVSMDCFSCHTDKRQPGTEASSMPADPVHRLVELSGGMIKSDNLQETDSANTGITQ